MPFTTQTKVTTIHRLMEMLTHAEATGKIGIVPFIEMAIRQVALAAI